jgi:predicted heme/steroid binding protein
MNESHSPKSFDARGAPDAPVPSRNPQALPLFTPASLSRFDGDRARAYVACQGMVFDVTDSPEWREGLHRNLHWAGQDLSEELEDAPHGIETLLRCPQVGRYQEAEGASPE